MSRRRHGRHRSRRGGTLERRFSGLLCVNKPSGATSHDVVDFIRGLLRRVRVGHCGTLDPMATGVLPLMLGAGTRLAEYVGQGVKGYEADILLDRTTDTGDITGQVTREFHPRDGAPPSLDAVRRRAGELTGEILQRPHRVSAVRVGGKRLYEMAREGAPVEAKPRPVQVHELCVQEYQYPRLTIRVLCGGGTYVRQLAEDLGEGLGLGGCLTRLVRTRVGGLTLRDAWTPFEIAGRDIQNEFLKMVIPLVDLFPEMAVVRVDEEGARRVGHGAALPPEEGEALPREAKPVSGLSAKVKIVGPAGQLLAIYSRGPTGHLEAEKVLA